MRGRSRSTAGWALLIATAALVILHQDWWDWDKVDPRMFGFLPIGLGYHLVYTVACAVLMWCFVRYLWPADLEDARPPDEEQR